MSDAEKKPFIKMHEKDQKRFQKEMSDLEAKRYSRIPTKGSLSLTNFDYQGDAIDQSITISKASATLTNDKMMLSEYSGTAGSTSYNMTGEITNYLGFALNDEVLKGSLSVTADQLAVGEWMADGEEEATESTDSEPMEVVRIPENVEFNLQTSVEKVTYNSLQMNNMKGRVIVNNGKVSLDDAGFNAMNGRVEVNGEYDSKPEKPTFDFKFGAKEISIPSSFQSLDMVRKMAPVTEKMTGLFSTDFSLKGILGADMMPDYASLTGGGLIQVLQASLGGQSDLLSGLSSVTKLAKVGTATLDKIKMTAEVKDGRLFIKPFDVKLGDYATQISGSTGIDGSIDYILKMNVPAGQVGAQLNSLVSSITGGNKLTGDNLVLNIGMGGVFTKPEFALRSVGTEEGKTVKNAVTAVVKDKVEEKKIEAKAIVDDKVNTAKDSANTIITAKKDSLKVKADSLIQSKKDTLSTLVAQKLGVNKDSTDVKLEEVKEKAKGVLKGLLKKKKKDNLPN